MDKLANMIMTVEAQSAALQTMSLNAAHLAALDGGATAMASLQKQVNTDTLDAVRDKYDEAMDQHNEMESAFSEAWSQPAGVGDDADLEAGECRATRSARARARQPPEGASRHRFVSRSATLPRPSQNSTR